ncbi:MAG: hypothetical protein JWM86_916 [Thermoleophilia bacterium]|nr:hypothetical protein [Thermoleophilia bacterium]
MAERTRTEHAHPAEVVPGRRFRRGMRGYRTGLVDDAIARLELRVDDLEHEAVELREALLDSQHETSEIRHDLTRARAELRYWNDRASYVDTEVARARQRATEVEQLARQRAETIEADAQERSLQLIDRVCTEANAIMQHARDEAREMFLRFETDVDMSQQRLDKLEAVRGEVARSMQAALHQFEDAVRELDKVAPARRIVAQLEGPTRRAVPTFGQDRALEAARRFEAGVETNAAASLSTPLTTTLAAQVEDAPAEANAAASEPVPAPSPTIDTVPDSQYSDRAHHEADEEFVSLLMQP